MLLPCWPGAEKNDDFAEDIIITYQRRSVHALFSLQFFIAEYSQLPDAVVVEQESQQTSWLCEPETKSTTFIVFVAHPVVQFFRKVITLVWGKVLSIAGSSHHHSFFALPVLNKFRLFSGLITNFWIIAIPMTQWIWFLEEVNRRVIILVRHRNIIREDRGSGKYLKRVNLAARCQWQWGWLQQL